MFKKVILTAIAVGLVSTFSVQLAPAEAAGMRGMTCWDASWAKYPNNVRMRRAWRRLCVANWQLHQG